MKGDGERDAVQRMSEAYFRLCKTHDPEMHSAHGARRVEFKIGSGAGVTDS